MRDGSEVVPEGSRPSAQYSPVIPWPGRTLGKEHAEEESTLAIPADITRKGFTSGISDFDEVWAPRLPEDNEGPDLELTNKPFNADALAEWTATDDQKAPRRRRRRRHQKGPPLGSKPINTKAYFRPFTVYPSKREEPASPQTLPDAIHS